MKCRSNPLYRVKEKQRNAVRHTDSYHDTGLVRYDPVAFDLLKMGIIGIRLIYHEDVAAMALVDHDKLLGLRTERSCQKTAITLDAVGRVEGIQSEIERVV